MAVDLHTHSTASDGSSTPTQLMAEAGAAGLTTIALTDHDTLEGIDEAVAAANRFGVELIPGVELSLEWDKGGMHLVVLWLEPGPGPLQDRLAALQEARSSRNDRILARLHELDIEVSLDELLEEAGAGSVGRPHIAAILVRKGYVSDIQQAFNLYLAKGAPAYFGRDRLTPEEGIALAREAGGVPVLAHPHTLGVDNRFEFAELMERLVGAGLVGVECHYGTYEAEGRRGLTAMARRFGLIPSGGSDYHGSYKPDVMLGTGKVGLTVPDHILEELAGRRGGG
jgi:predicted metal-dependent phosphoesterase TrpH